MAETETGEPSGRAHRDHGGHERVRGRRGDAAGASGLVGRFITYIGADAAPSRARPVDADRRLGDRLRDALVDHGVVLHHRRAPLARGSIDHVAIAPSGVWVIDADYHTGKVQQRSAGGLFRTEERVYVGGRDRTDAARNLRWQVDAVRAVLGDLAGDDVPVRPALCIVGAEWPWFARPFTVHGVRVVWPQELYDAVTRSGPMSRDHVRDVAERLAESLPRKH